MAGLLPEHVLVVCQLDSCSHVFECMKNSPIAGHSCSLAVPLHVMLAAILPKGVVAVVAVHYSLVKSWMPCSTTSSALLNS